MMKQQQYQGAERRHSQTQYQGENRRRPQHDLPVGGDPANDNPAMSSQERKAEQEEKTQQQEKDHNKH